MRCLPSLHPQRDCVGGGEGIPPRMLHLRGLQPPDWQRRLRRGRQAAGALPSRLLPEVCSRLRGLQGAHHPAGREGRLQDRVPGQKLPRGLLSV
ncbi:hypothetical protein L345_08104, partial [Ophiophagus hannah]